MIVFQFQCCNLFKRKTSLRTFTCFFPIRQTAPLLFHRPLIFYRISFFFSPSGFSSSQSHEYRMTFFFHSPPVQLSRCVNSSQDQTCFLCSAGFHSKQVERKEGGGERGFSNKPKLNRGAESVSLKKCWAENITMEGGKSEWYAKIYLYNKWKSKRVTCCKIV